MQKIIRSSIVLLFIFILLVFYNSLNRETNYSTDHLIGNKLSNVNLTGFDDKKVYTSEDLRENNYTLINFWASWCAPCKIEHPILMKLSQKKNLMILGINFKDKEPQAKIFLSELGNPYGLLAKDKNGKHSVKFGIYGIPESILINKELMIIKKFVGPLSVDDYNNIIKIIK